MPWKKKKTHVHICRIHLSIRSLVPHTPEILRFNKHSFSFLLVVFSALLCIGVVCEYSRLLWTLPIATWESTVCAVAGLSKVNSHYDRNSVLKRLCNTADSSYLWLFGPSHLSAVVWALSLTFSLSLYPRRGSLVGIHSSELQTSSWILVIDFTLGKWLF